MVIWVHVLLAPLVRVVDEVKPVDGNTSETVEQSLENGH